MTYYTRAALLEAFLKGFQAGFDVSGEGFNNEYPFNQCPSEEDKLSLQAAETEAVEAFARGLE